MNPFLLLVHRLRIHHQTGDIVAGYGSQMDVKTKRDLDLVIVAVSIGALFSVITGFPGASPIFTAYLKDLGLSNKLYGAVLTIPQLTILIQVPVSVYLARHGRVKQTSILSWVVMKPLFILLGVVPLLGNGISQAGSLLLSVLVLLVGSLLLWIGDIGLNIWLGSMIPSQCRGQFFGTRQRMITLFNVGFALLIAAILPLLRSDPHKYAILFILAGVSGLADALIYLKIRPPEGAFQPLQKALGTPVKLKAFAEPFHDKHYRAFIGFSIFWYFALSLSGPYFNVFMLNNIGSTLGEQTILMQILPGVATFLFIRKTGRLNDLYGNRPVMLVSGLVVCLTPVVWLFVTPATLFLVVLSNMVGGVFAATIDLSVLNMSIFFVSSEKRSIYLTARSISTILLGVVPAMILGGVLYDALGSLLSRHEIGFFLGQRLGGFHVLLILSFVFRVIALFVFGRKIKENTATSAKRMMRDISARQKYVLFRILLWLVQLLSFTYHRIRGLRSRLLHR